MATISASPTTTSQAATVIMKITINWPKGVFVYRNLLSAAKFMFAALNISSMDINMPMMFLLVMTPKRPIANIIAESISKWFSVIFITCSFLQIKLRLSKQQL